MIGRAGRDWASWALLAIVAGPALAQTPPPPAVPPAVTVTLQPPVKPGPPDALLPPPKKAGPPEQLLPTPKKVVPPPAPVKPPEPPTPAPAETPLPKAPPAPQVPPGVLTSVSPAGVSAAGLATRPVDFLPLPGGLEDQLQREYAARASFRHCTWTGTTITALPNSLLWQPPFAIKREPRMLVLPSALDNYDQSWTLDTSIGTTVGFWRFEPAGRDAAYQVDLFGVVHSRLTPDDLVAADYRFGVPLTARRGPWQFKLAYEHTSSHLVDDFIRHQSPARLNEFIRDEAVFGVGRCVAGRLRVYGQVAYAFQMTYPNPTRDAFHWRFDTGFEWYNPEPTGWKGTPFVAFNLDSRGDAAFQPGVTAQAGWLWRNPYQRLANIRLFGEYTNSRSPYGQFYLNREDFYAVGLACDY
ncbi:MAG TPA: DUF1207 domain-containing protein [Fimbriiglobus sp.]|nr:DUF1207 domain-containing protein [Fimbriiglobus sp.]